MKKVLKKVFKGIGAIILAGIIVFLAIYVAPYPRYLKNKSEMKIDEAINTDEIRIMSYNIRCHAPDDIGKKSWFYRAHWVADVIEKAQPTIIGFQEVVCWQYNYLADVMTSYDSVITYRDNIPLYAEGCPIFYRTDLYDLVDQGSFWLSETPEVMSKDWGAECYRICSYVILKDKTTEKDFVVFNTHLDHVSDEARIKGIQVILDKIEDFGSIPAMLIGDLNAKEDQETYTNATNYFLDAKYQTENTMTSCTYHKWGEKLDIGCIDYVLISKTDFKVNSYNVIKDTYDGNYTSDHFPIIASLTFE